MENDTVESVEVVEYIDTDRITANAVVKTVTLAVIGTVVGMATESLLKRAAKKLAAKKKNEVIEATAVEV